MSHGRYADQEWVQDLWEDMGNDPPGPRGLTDDNIREVFDLLKEAGIGGDDFISGNDGHPDFGTTTIPGNKPQNSREEDNLTPSVSTLAKLYQTDGEGNVTLRTDFRDTSTPQADRPLDQGVDQTEFGTKHWEGTKDYRTRGTGTPYSDDPVTRTTGSAFVPGEDPNKTTFSLSDLNSYMAIEYAAPGREGDFKTGQDDPRKKGDIEYTDYGSTAGQEAVDELRTKFIDEVYGTVNGVNTTGQPLEINEAVNNNWGLDLVRDWSNAALQEHFGEGVNKNNLTEQQTYEWQTRGLVNWEFYRTDAAFAAAFRDQFPDVDGKTATGLDNEAGITSVGEIRELLPSVYQEMITRSQGKDAWRSTWDGKYEPPPLQDAWTPVELDVDSLTEGQEKLVQDEPAAGPTREVIDAATFRQSLKIGRTEVGVSNIKFESGRRIGHGLTGPIADRTDPVQTTQPKGD